MHRIMTGAPDVQIEGRMGFYNVFANSPAGHNWMRENVALEKFQGTSKQFVCDDSRFMHEIADAIVDAGLSVEVNGRTYHRSAA